MQPSSLRKASWAARMVSTLSRPSRRCISHRVLIARLLEAEGIDGKEHSTVNGHVRSVRNMKSVQFVSVGDGSSLAPMQAVVPNDQAQGLAVGAAVRLTGSWQPSRGGQQSHELHVSNVEVLGPSDARTFPLQKKHQTAEYLRTMPHLRPRTPFNAALLRLRSAAIASLTHFFADQQFTQTHPPIITSSDCEGAGEVFTIRPASEKTPEEGGKEFFSDKKYLTVSTQLHLEALSQSVGNVWTLSPTFRAERSDTTRHLSEFYMLEVEMGFADKLGHIMDLTEDMLRHLSSRLYETQVAREILTRTKQVGAHLRPEDQVRRRWEGFMQRDWPRVTYTEAMAALQTRASLFRTQPTWGMSLLAEHEKYLADVVGGGQKPVFVTDYPQDTKAFYMLQGPSRPQAESAGDGSGGATVECFDLLVPDYLEIAGGSMREHRLENLLAAMRHRGLEARPLEPPSGAVDTKMNEGRGTGGALDWYVHLRRWGCPPHGGFGLGFDRLLSYLAGVPNIRDTVAFPRWCGRCDC